MKNTMTSFAPAYLAILIAFGLLDGIWLGVIAMPLYVDYFSGLLRAQFISWPWIVFYLLYCLAVVVLAVRPARGRPVGAAAANGFMLGATAYGTYNLTAYSIIAGGPLTMTLVDWVWGAFATMVLAGVGAQVVRWRERRS